MNIDFEISVVDYIYLGGLSQFEDNPDKLTNPDLRKARFDLLYKEYEVRGLTFCQVDQFSAI